MAEVYGEISGLFSKPNHVPDIRYLTEDPYVVAIDLEVANEFNTSADGNSIIEVLLTQADVDTINEVINNNK